MWKFSPAFNSYPGPTDLIREIWYGVWIIQTSKCNFRTRCLAASFPLLKTPRVTSKIVLMIVPLNRVLPEARIQRNVINWKEIMLIKHHYFPWRHFSGLRRTGINDPQLCSDWEKTHLLPFLEQIALQCQYIHWPKNETRLKKRNISIGGKCTAVISWKGQWKCWV